MIFVMLQSHVNLLRPLPQVGKHGAQHVHVVLAAILLHLQPPLQEALVLETGAVAAGFQLWEDKLILGRSRRGGRDGRGEISDITRLGGWWQRQPGAAAESLELLNFLLVSELQLLVVLDVLLVAVHGELGARRLRGQDGWRRRRAVAGGERVSHGVGVARHHLVLFMGCVSERLLGTSEWWGR